MEVRPPRATAIVVQRVPAAKADWFMDWQQGVTKAASGFPGYLNTEIFPPADSTSEDWVVLVHFRDHDALQHWIASPLRGQWVDRLKAHVGAFELSGFGPWFAGLPKNRDIPPSWKMALTVVLGLYPTVMLLTIFVSPYTNWMGFAAAMLVGNALSVSILQWGLMPALTRLFSSWLNRGSKHTVTIGGAVLIALLLAGMVLIFHQVKLP